MSIKLYWIALLATPLFAGEYAVFSSGSRIHIDRHEASAETIRLFTKDGVSEVPAASITAFEADDYLAPIPVAQVEVPPAPVAKPTDPKTMLHDAATRYALPPSFVESVAKIESALNPGAVSPKGAIGVMQLMPATARALSADPNDPEQNIDAGTRLLRELLLKYNGDVVKALAAYNAGTGAVEKYQGLPPYRETQTYVDKVIQNYLKVRRPITGGSKQRFDGAQNGSGDDIGSRRGGMDAVVLHVTQVLGDDIGKKKRDQHQPVLGGEILVDFLEIANVIGTVIGRQSHSGQHHARAGLLERGDHLIQIGSGVFERHSTQPIVSAQFEDDDGGMERGGRIDPRDAAFGGIAADAEIDDVPRQIIRVQFFLQIVGKTLSGREAVAGADAVAEDHQDFPVVRGRGRRSGNGRRRGARIVGLRCIVGAGTGARKKQREKEKIPHLPS